MNNTKDRHQGTKMSNRRCCFTIVHSLFLIFLWSGQAMAACQTASITASTPTSAFIVNGNGTVTHIKTGLMWKVCSEGQTWTTGSICTNSVTTSTWQGALQLAQTLNTTGGGFAGFTDWRVPNQKELASIVEAQCVSPSINTVIFPATVSSFYWSASPYAGSVADAWFVNFNRGNDNYNFKSVNFDVRLVRGGQ